MKRISFPLMAPAVIALALCLCLFGGVLVHRAAQMPPVTDQKALADLLSQMPPWTGGASGTIRTDTARAAGQDFERQWFADRNALLTDKWPLHDRGLALIALGLSLFAMLIILRPAKAERMIDLKTPKSRFLLLAIGPLTLALSVVAMAMREAEWRERAIDPSWADSPAVMVVGAFLVVTILLVMLIAGWWFTRNTTLPVSLWATDRSRYSLRPGPRLFRPTLSMLSTVASELIWVAFALIVLEMTVSSLWNGNYLDVPLGFLWLYLVLVARAVTVAHAHPVPSGETA
ncbi:MAG: hypothetical protein PW791_08735 [Neorhizobium sp.]|nr:hypothetical protein [Neorhizobium sp.]